MVTIEGSSLLPVTDAAGEDKDKSRSATIVLTEMSELLLLIGWLDRARASVPPPPLVVRFGPCERRIWLDVVAAFAQQHP